LDHKSKRRKKNNSSRDKIYEKKGRVHFDRLYNKNTETAKELKIAQFEQNTGIQKETGCNI